MANYDGDVFVPGFFSSAKSGAKAGYLTVPSGGGTITYRQMRALADPGPGYEVWTATTDDFAGAGAAGAIQAGTAVVVMTW